MAANQSPKLTRSRQFGFARVSIPPCAPRANQGDTAPFKPRRVPSQSEHTRAETRLPGPLHDLIRIVVVNPQAAGVSSGVMSSTAPRTRDCTDGWARDAAERPWKARVNWAGHRDVGPRLKLHVFGRTHRSATTWFAATTASASRVARPAMRNQTGKPGSGIYISREDAVA